MPARKLAETDALVLALHHHVLTQCVAISSIIDTIPPEMVLDEMRELWLVELRQAVVALGLVVERLADGIEAPSRIAATRGERRQRGSLMRLPAEGRDGLVKLPLSPRQASPMEAFTEGKKGRLYFRFPHLRPGAVDAIVQQIDRDTAVFRLAGPIIAPPPLDTVPTERQVLLAGAWVWTWEESKAKHSGPAAPAAGAAPPSLALRSSWPLAPSSSTP